MSLPLVSRTHGVLPPQIVSCRATRTSHSILAKHPSPLYMRPWPSPLHTKGFWIKLACGACLQFSPYVTLEPLTSVYASPPMPPSQPQANKQKQENVDTRASGRRRDGAPTILQPSKKNVKLSSTLHHFNTTPRHRLQIDAALNRIEMRKPH